MARAAIRPLRTADSIVSGQPVSVHAPAMAIAGSVGTLPARVDPGLRKPRGLGIARDGACDQVARRQRGRKTVCTSLPRQRFEFGGRKPHVFVGCAEAATQIAGRLFENPLQRRFECGGKIETDLAPRRATGGRRGSGTGGSRRVARRRTVRGVAEHLATARGGHRQHDGVERRASRRQATQRDACVRVRTRVTAVERCTASARLAAAAARCASGTLEKPKRGADGSRKERGR